MDLSSGNGRIHLVHFAGEDGKFSFDALPLGTYNYFIQDAISNGVAGGSVVIESDDNGKTIDTGNIILDNLAPFVVSTDPESGASDVNTPDIKIIFSEKIDSRSVSRNT